MGSGDVMPTYKVAEDKYDRYRELMITGSHSDNPGRYDKPKYPSGVVDGAVFGAGGVWRCGYVVPDRGR